MTGLPTGAVRDLGPGDGAVGSPPTRVTYLGHATILLESPEGNVLTDPVFCDRIGGWFTKRAAPSTFEPESLGPVAGVLISHPHHDHLDYPSLRRIPPAPPIVVPWGVATSLHWHGFSDVRVTRAWESVSLGGWTVVAVPSRHFGGRLPLLGTSGHLGYVLSGSSCIYFAGDTGLDEELFREIGRRFAIDLAILPIAGAVFPWFRPNHMNATDALRALECLGAAQLLPIHYATYPVSFEPSGEAVSRLRSESTRQGVASRVRILREGASLILDGSKAGRVERSGHGPAPVARATA
jgi:L-ascorbate metabolism protein UlaG (beta-lactamase superfamily)